MRLFALALLAVFPLFGGGSKVLICGVCRDVEPAVPHTIREIERLGERFDEYAVIVYENNSSDHTPFLLTAWADVNPRVYLMSERLPQKELPPTREERIARARNRVLELAANNRFEEYAYLVMADLDFTAPWPVEEIVETVNGPCEWDCVSANGVFGSESLYWDRYAYRCPEFPFGPELLGDYFWRHLWQNLFAIEGDELLPVFSAFGGLAIYKRDTLIQFTYSGKPTEELRAYYAQILPKLSPRNPHLLRYLGQHSMKGDAPPLFRPIRFQKGVPCCEHVALHAQMALQGYGRFYIHPKMVMRYSHDY